MPAMQNSFAREFEKCKPDQIITITCVDYREHAREGFLFTSAGNVVNKYLVDDLHLILPGKKMLLLRGHTDCAKSKKEVPQQIGEDLSSYHERVERRTLERLWDQARVLLTDAEIRAGIGSGLRFCAAMLDTHTGLVRYYERQSALLISEALTSRDISELRAPEQVAA